MVSHRPEEKPPLGLVVDGRFILFDSHDLEGHGSVCFAVGRRRKTFPVAQTNLDGSARSFLPTADGSGFNPSRDATGLCAAVSWAREQVADFDQRRHASAVAARWERRCFMSASTVGSWRFRLNSYPGEPPEVGAPVAPCAPPLGGAVQQADFRHQYMVSADGQRF